MSETEDGDSDGGLDDENDDDEWDGDSIVVDDDIHEGSTADFEAVRERESSSSEMLTCKCKSWAVSFISWVLTLEVLASGRLMEVGRSIEVRLKLVVIFRRNFTLFWNKHATGVVLLVHTAVVNFYLGLYFPSSYSWNKAKVCVAST